MSRADLHMHSTVSDGGYDVPALIKKCAEAGLTVISLTDHDSTDGVETAEKMAEFYGIKLISGIELSTRFHGQSVDILGYGIDICHPFLQEKLQFHRGKRIDRMQKMINLCQETGLEVTFEEVEKEVTGVTFSRPHLANVLIKKDYGTTVQDIFNKYIGYGKPCYVHKEDEMSPEEAMEIIHLSGGVAVAAHPVYYDIDEHLTSWLKEKKLDGVEVYHRDHDEKNRKRFNKLVSEAEKSTGIKFFRTGGTDFHHESYGRSGEIIGGALLPYEEAVFLQTYLSSR
ncbi:PHP domain-containing protein [Alkalicoccus halolimnae]|uniref:PHP domain-containing protein n=1 Tax=Alkalicoccus halolimnae TaxID=1667239 RepID=A0AAJ8LTM8_9BACI|nr:PHP domain-containing protein [Alkalicoccus halolimnae]